MIVFVHTALVPGTVSTMSFVVRPSLPRISVFLSRSCAPRLSNSLQTNAFLKLRPKIPYAPPRSSYCTLTSQGPLRGLATSLSGRSSAPRLFQQKVVHFSWGSSVKATHKDFQPSRFPPPNPRNPWRLFLRWVENIPSDIVFYAIIAANAVVFSLWVFARSEA